MPTLTKIHEPHAVAHAPAGHWGVGTMADPERFILHDTESHDASGAGDITGIWSGWLNAEPRLGYLPGAHYIVDEDGNIGKTAPITAILNGAGGLNTGSIQIEQIGFASFDEADWLKRSAQLDAVARLLAWGHVQLGIPLEVPSPQGEGEPMRGVMTHAMVSRFSPKSLGHTDPGVGFPLGHEIAKARGYVAAGGWPKGGRGNAISDKPRQPQPRPRRTWRVDYTNRQGEPHVTTTHHLLTWLATHPGARRRAGSWQPIHKHDRKG